MSTVYHHIWQDGEHIKTFKEMSPREVGEEEMFGVNQVGGQMVGVNDMGGQMVGVNYMGGQVVGIDEVGGEMVDEVGGETVSDVAQNEIGSDNGYTISLGCKNSLAGRMVDMMNIMKPGNMCNNNYLEDLWRTQSRAATNLNPTSKKCFKEVEEGVYQDFLTKVSDCTRCDQPVIKVDETTGYFRLNDTAFSCLRSID